MMISQLRVIINYLFYVVLDGYIQNFTNSFLFLAGAPDGIMNTVPITGILYQLKKLGESSTEYPKAFLDDDAKQSSIKKETLF